MNGEVPSVPITTLSGISSLTDLLTELPLPTPLPCTVNNKGLLYSPRVAEEAKRLLGVQDENLVPQLLHALSQTNTDNIELKDKSSSNEIEGDIPGLLQAILARNPNVFKHKRMEQMGGVSPRQPMAPSPYYQQSPEGAIQHSPYSRTHNMGMQGNSSPLFTPNSPAAYPQGSSVKVPLGSPTRYQHAGLTGQGSPVPTSVNGYTGHQLSPATATSPSQPVPTPPPVQAKSRSQLAQPPNGAGPSGDYVQQPTPRGRGRPRKRPPNLEVSQRAVSVRETDAASSAGAYQSPASYQAEPQTSQESSSLDVTESDSSVKDSSRRKKRKSHKEDRERDKELPQYNIVSSPDTSGSTKIKLKLTRFPVKFSESKEKEKLPEAKRETVVRQPETVLTAQPETVLKEPEQVVKEEVKRDTRNVAQESLYTFQEDAKHSERTGVSDVQDEPQTEVHPLNKEVTLPNKEVTLPNKDIAEPDEVTKPPEEPKPQDTPKSLGVRQPEDIPQQEDASASEARTSTQEKDGDGDSIIANKSEDGDTVSKSAISQPRILLTKISISEDQVALLAKPMGRGKKRQRKNTDTDEEWEPAPPPASRQEALPSPVSQGPPAQIFIERDEEDDEEEAPKKRLKRDKTPNKKATYLDDDELTESATFKRFHAAMEAVFEGSEDMDISVEQADDEEETDECNPELLISKPVLNDLVSESAKLKSMGVMNQIPHEKLVRLLNILERNIRDGTKVKPNINHDEGGRGERLWRELAMERITHSVDSALTALYVMTADAMPKEVFIEDVIDRTANLAKFQLQNSIYPEFDPVYRVGTDKNAVYTNMKMKRARAHGSSEKSIIALYNKLCVLVANLGELLDIQILTDSTVLLVSSIGTAPFFVENISELQLSAMKLISTVFSKYEKHRQLILEDIFASLARLPSSKKNLRNFRLNQDTNVQMVTALVLQLIQCVVVLPQPKDDSEGNQEESDDEYSYDDDDLKKSREVDKDVLIINTYETAVRTGQNFLSVFLKKCVSRDEEDYRPLFENFVQDLLSAVNKPEWPAAELLLSLLGRLLMHQFSNRSNDMTMRVSSLDYLGQIASRLRKHAVSSYMDQGTLDTIVTQTRSAVAEQSGDENDSKDSDQTDYIQNLQQAMLDYLSYNSQNDPAILFARHFLVAQWYRDTTAEVEQTIKAPPPQRDDSDDDEDSDRENRAVDMTTEILQEAERRKLFLKSFIKVSARSNLSFKRSRHILTYESASLVARYLASKRPFSQSFDIYLSQILRVLSETAVAVRTKAMKCLSSVVAADPSVLARADVQRSVHCRFMDQSTSVREAAVELVGKFVLMKPELINRYFSMLIERILDTGISVRKRVIKTLRDICIEQPDFPKVPEICNKIIRRVNDEEGIKKLVNETFQQMWFSPLPTTNTDKLLKRALNVIEVVAASKEHGYDWLEQLLTNLLKAEEDARHKPVQKACLQITDCLVEHVLRLELQSTESSAEGRVSSQRLVSCLQTLYLFSKVKPELMVTHATTFQPYLSTRCSTQGDFLVVHNVARILELVVPLMDHPSEIFLASLEEDMMKLIIRHGQTVLQSCVSCLGAVVNKVTHNYKLVRDCFQKYFAVLSKLKTEHEANPESATMAKNKNTLLRALFTVGLFCKHFDFDAGIKHSKQSGDSPRTPKNPHVPTSESPQTVPNNVYTSKLLQMIPNSAPNMVASQSVTNQVPIRERVFDVLFYFCYHEDEEVRMKAITGAGFLCNRHADFLLGTKMKTLYWDILMDTSTSTKLVCQVLRNLQLYLTEEDERMRRADAEWNKMGNKEDLKEMGDVQSGMSSSVMQLYLKQVMEAMIHTLSVIRLSALQVVIATLKQGLVHPVQCVPYLIAMGSDPEATIRIKADQQLSDIDSRYPGFIQMKALAGIKMAFRLQKLLQEGQIGPLRGMREKDSLYSLTNHTYSIIRGHRQHRRALLLCLLNLFDEQAKTELDLLVFVADNLAYFPYVTQDEPLFVMHHIEITVSVSGANLLQSFKDSFQKKQPSRPGSRSSRESVDGKKGDDFSDDDDEDEEVLMGLIPEDPCQLLECCVASQACIMLLVLKQHLKDMYGFRDSTIHRYSPTEPSKAYDKSLNRKCGITFNPARALELLTVGQPKTPLTEKEKKDIVAEYLDFKQLMELMDPSDDEDEDGDRPDSSRSKTPTAAVASSSAHNTSGNTNDDSRPQSAAGAASPNAVVVVKDDDDSDAAPSTPPSVEVHKVKRPKPKGRRPSQKAVKKTSKPRKKRRRFVDDSDEEEDSEDSDPDFMV
ncbi:nipped-B-like protein A isoform X2 [Acanthaster planci]|uniref:Nipped-B protein n=1 Tax=Acanthaster planci TaxID=133434 RepID=A0A8B7ZAV1_ACAPL|nr:nipped-B-like protein A isoform X2 [Acanthaster planci]